VYTQWGQRGASQSVEINSKVDFGYRTAHNRETLIYIDIWVGIFGRNFQARMN